MKYTERHRVTLTNDGKCNDEGHELLPRLCIHCGMTIHEISDANSGALPMREAPDMIQEQIDQYERFIKNGVDRIDKAEKSLVDDKAQLKKLRDCVALLREKL
jgi:hypothetical protein